MINNQDDELRFSVSPIVGYREEGSKGNIWGATWNGDYPNGIPVKLDSCLPRGTVILVDSKGTVQSILRISNGEGYENGWCIGEMK